MTYAAQSQMTKEKYENIQREQRRKWAADYC